MAIRIHTEQRTARASASVLPAVGGVLEQLQQRWAARNERTPNDTRKERLYKELAVLLQAGVDPRAVLDLLHKAQTDPQLQHLIGHLRSEVMLGRTLSEAMGSSPAFNEHERYSVRIGEESGRMAEVFDQLALHYAERLKLKRLVRQAFAYPLFVLVVTLGVVAFMMSVIVPMFAQVFSRTGTELPALTQAVLHVAEVLRWIWPYLLGAVALLIVLWTRIRNRPKVAAVAERLRWRFPVLGPMARLTNMARVCGSMAFLLQAGTPLDKALDLTAHMCGSPRIATALLAIRDRVVRGRSLREGLAEHSEFDASMVAMIGVAEEVKQLDRMFSRLATTYTEDVQHRTTLLGSVLEPATILVIAVLVGTVLVAMYLPMFKLSTAF
ncbi:MAG: type II secretion system F family protein [Flavobacteriales bacterium]|nr:type II secretion system F family protein [Flavobacteriales bacterium]